VSYLPGPVAAGAACCSVLSFVTGSGVLADGLLIIGMTGLSLGTVSVHIAGGRGALRTSTPIRQFNQIGACELGRLWASGLRLALDVSSELAGVCLVALTVAAMRALTRSRAPRGVDPDSNDAARQFAQMKEKQEATSRFWGGFFP
jgi:hypothetical protein